MSSQSAAPASPGGRHPGDSFALPAGPRTGTPVRSTRSITRTCRSSCRSRRCAQILTMAYRRRIEGIVRIDVNRRWRSGAMPPDHSISRSASWVGHPELRTGIWGIWEPIYFGSFLGRPMLVWIRKFWMSDTLMFVWPTTTIFCPVPSTPGLCTGRDVVNRGEIVRNDVMCSVARRILGKAFGPGCGRLRTKIVEAAYPRHDVLERRGNGGSVALATCVPLALLRYNGELGRKEFCTCAAVPLNLIQLRPGNSIHGDPSDCSQALILS